MIGFVSDEWDGVSTLAEMMEANADPDGNDSESNY